MNSEILGNLVRSMPCGYGEHENINKNIIDVAKVSNISSDGHFKGDFEKRSFSDKEILKLIVNNNDLLVVKSSGSKSNILSGKTAIYKSNDNIKLIASNFLLRLEPIESKVCPKYLWYFLNSKLSKEYIKSIVGATTYPNLKWDLYKLLPIPYPPLETQKKIAAILDKADELRQNDKKILQKYEQLTQSVFLEMFGDTKLNPKKWDILLIEEISSEIIDCPHSTPKYVDQITDFPCVRTTELRNGYIDWSSMKYLDKEGYFDRTKRLIPNQGDIIYGREGSFGEAAIIPPNTRMSLGQRVMLFRPKYKIINSQYFLALIRSKGLYDQAVSKTSGSTVGHVNIKDIRKFKCPIPPISLQNRFAEIIDSIEDQRQISIQSLQKSEELFQSLLQRAFKGELA